MTRALLTALTLLLPSIGHAATHYLSNDGFVSPDEIGFQAGFWDGECWASTYVPNPSFYPITLDYVEMAVYSATSPDGFYLLRLHKVDTTGKPLDLVAESYVYMTGSTSAFSRLDVGSSDWLVGTPPFVFTEPFAVSVCIDDLTVGYGASSYPQIGRDTESGSVSYPDRNWIYDTTGNWRRSTFYGLTGDWIMRTSVSYDDGSTTGTGGSTGTSTTTTTGSTTTTGPTTTTGSTSSTHTTDTGISDTAEPTGTSEPGPRVTSLIQISPTEWQAGETPDLIVLGEWLQTGVELRVGGLSATNVELIPFIDDPDWGDTVLARAPSALPAGVHDVEVVNPDGSSAFLAQAVEVKADGAGLGDTGPGDVAKPATECGCQHSGAASLYWAPWCALLLAARRRG